MTPADPGSGPVGSPLAPDLNDPVEPGSDLTAADPGGSAPLVPPEIVAQSMRRVPPRRPAPRSEAERAGCSRSSWG